MNDTTPQENLLEDVQLEWEQEDASTGQRFVNYIVDIISFYIFIFAVAFIAAAIIPGAAEYLASLDGSPAIFERLLSLVLYGFYMGVVEGIFKGKTLGKLITRTKAIQETGELLTFSKALSRGLCRMVPFEAFSALGRRPWHDTWTNTRVIKAKK